MHPEDPYQAPKSDLDQEDRSDTLEAKKILAGAIVFVIRARVPLAKAYAAPLGLFVLLLVVMSQFGSPAMVFPALVAMLALYTIAAITTHRILILGPRASVGWSSLRWGKRETFFALHVILVGICTLPASLFALVPQIGSFLVPFVAALITSRLSLVFPGIAIDKGVTIPVAWRMSSKYTWPLYVSVLVFPLVFGLLSALFQLTPGLSIIGLIVQALGMVFAFAALSIAYSEIQRREYGA